MIIEMPFLHKVFATTTKTPEPRHIAAWDMERLRIEDLSKSDLEPGADLGEYETLLLDGQHWANIKHVFPRTYSPSGLSEQDMALAILADKINTTRFFAAGLTKLPQTSILRATPSPEHVRTSEREVNVANLSAWVGDNLAGVDGELFVRVQEPTLPFDIVGPFSGRSFMTIKTPRLLPHHVLEDYGVLFTVEAKHELAALARKLLTDDHRMMRIDNDVDATTFERMRCPTNEASEVARRALFAHACRLTYSIYRHVSPPELVASLKRIFSNPLRELDQDAMDRVAELLTENVAEISWPMSAMTQIILERWHDRPVTLSLGGQAHVRLPDGPPR